MNAVRPPGRGSQAECGGHRHQLGKGVGLHLAHHLASVRLDRDFADAKFSADLLVQPPRDDNAMTSRSRGVSDS
jgi:hypothetical protein